MPARISIEGHRYGRLKVVVEAGKRPSRWLCLCDCGESKVVRTGDLRSGKTTSCGCFRKEFTGNSKRLHGHAGNRSTTPTYTAWKNMVHRCTNPKDKRFSDYGGRGIKVCERWMTFTNFLSDMGEKPWGLTIERINNDDGYYPDNCKWATAIEQSLNKRHYRNNLSGFKGATFDKRNGKWHSHITINRQSVFLGYFDTPQAATAAYSRARKMRGN